MAAHISRIKSVSLDTHKSQPVSQEKGMKKSVFADSGSDGLDPRKQSDFNMVSNLINPIGGTKSVPIFGCRAISCLKIL